MTNRSAFQNRISALMVLTALFSISIAALLVPYHAFAQKSSKDWRTLYEQSGGMKTPRYAETMEYCRRLEKASPWIKVTSFGRSPEGRDLPLVIATTGKEFTPAAARKSGKTILLIQNGIHAGEIDGKDACMMLLRDIAITKSKAALLDHLILMVIPIYNVDGHERFGANNRINQDGPEEMGWRVTAQNLNLNRDYMKADAPETQAFLRLFNSWLPDFFVDCHVTDGADYQYTVTYSMESHENVAQPIRSWIKQSYIPGITARMDASGIKLAEYIFFVDDKQPSKGLTGGTAQPRFSTTYTAMQNRPGLLIETHMLKPYKMRVEGTYAMLEHTMEIMNNDYKTLRRAVTDADAETASNIENPFPLQFDLNTTIPSRSVHFLGIRSKVDHSDISGGERVTYTGEPFEEDIPRFDSITATVSITPPFGYLIPRQWETVISRLKDHGIELQELSSAESLDVEVYHFSNTRWQQRPFEGRHAASYKDSLVRERKLYPAGTVFVPIHQRAARIAVHALEPNAPDAFAAWGFFDAVFEQKEYAEDYVMEKLAPQMLASNPSLKKTFESRLASDTAFVRSPSARLQFFYENSPYWDKEMNVYPVARIPSQIKLPLRRLTAR